MANVVTVFDANAMIMLRYFTGMKGERKVSIERRWQADLYSPHPTSLTNIELPMAILNNRIGYW